MMRMNWVVLCWVTLFAGYVDLFAVRVGYVKVLLMELRP